MKKVIIFNMQFDLLRAEEKAGQCINWLVMSREPDYNKNVTAADFEDYIKEFVVGPEQWPERVLYEYWNEN
jgi:hypothetical protein